MCLCHVVFSATKKVSSCEGDKDSRKESGTHGGGGDTDTDGEGGDTGKAADNSSIIQRPSLTCLSSTAVVVVSAVLSRGPRSVR